jgi:hypothetical protein
MEGIPDTYTGVPLLLRHGMEREKSFPIPFVVLFPEVFNPT